MITELANNRNVYFRYKESILIQYLSCGSPAKFSGRVVRIYNEQEMEQWIIYVAHFRLKLHE